MANGMQHHQAVVVHQGVNLCEKLCVMVHTHMLEHADRNDPVKALADVSIIPQVEAHTIGKPKPLRLLVGKRMLLLG